MHIRHILFDLDGTLLPMNQDEFVTFLYADFWQKNIYPRGFPFDPKSIYRIRVEGLWSDGE